MGSVIGAPGESATHSNARPRRRPRFLLIPLLLVTGCSLFRESVPDAVPIYRARATSGDLEAGAAVVDVTPDSTVWMAGYHRHRRSEGVHDPITVRALVLRRGDFRVALVAADVIGIQREDLLWIHDSIEGLDPRHLIVAATHNHSGPDTLGLWGSFLGSGQDRRVMRRLRNGIVEALRRAEEACAPAEIATGSLHIDAGGLHFNVRRRGLEDREVCVAHVRRRGGGDTIATLIELGCHPEVLGPANGLLTADFPHYTVIRLEEALGGVGIYVSGAVGGLVTPDVEGSVITTDGSTFEEAARMGRRLADHGVSVVRTLASYDSAPALSILHTPLYLEIENLYYDVARWIGILEREYFGAGSIVTEVNLWQVGAMRIATVPGEITPDLGLRIKRNTGGSPAMLIGLANDELGYLVPEADYDLPIYGYERTLCVGPSAGDRIVRALEDLSLVAAQE